MDAIESARGIYFPNLELKEEQVKVLLNVINGISTIASLPVGFGKSILFQILPAAFDFLGKPNKVLVVCPLNTIIKDHIQRLKLLQIHAIGLDISCKDIVDKKNKVLDAVEHSKVILCHPEALFCQDGQTLLLALQNHISAIVIDECHKVEEWGREFRQDFKELHQLKSFFPDIPFLCLSGTMLPCSIHELGATLHIKDYALVAKSPDIENMYFNVIEKCKGDHMSVIEEIYTKELEKLKVECSGYPVTLIFMSLQYMAHAMRYAHKLFGTMSFLDSQYAAMYANQDKMVVEHIVEQLKMEHPTLRLVFCTSVIGMGFDSPSVENIIHIRPPRSLSNFIQEAGRAGRRGQRSICTIYYCKSDIAPNVQGLQSDIVDVCTTQSCKRECILKHFGFTKSLTSPKGCKCCSFCRNLCTCEHCNSKTTEN